MTKKPLIVKLRLPRTALEAFPHDITQKQDAVPAPQRKLTLKFGKKPTPDAPTPKEASPEILQQIVVDHKAAIQRPPKPKTIKPVLKLSAPKKRDHDTANAGDDALPSALAGPLMSATKKIKFTSSKKTPATPVLRIKAKGRPPTRDLGVGYDSEASDREHDPFLEEEFVLRMLPGEDCDYMRKAIEEKNWPAQGNRSGGADIRFKFLRADGRRAILTIQKRHYAASIVDLPCMVEGMKSWDKKSWYKAADICQMLLVLGPVKDEAEANEFPLPIPDVNPHTFAYAHGLTPPMKWVRKRRFRKRVSTRQIEQVEDEVERLFEEDRKCEGPNQEGSTEYVVEFPGMQGRNSSEQGEGGYDDEDTDGEGDTDNMESYFDEPEEIDDHADIEAMLEADDDALYGDMQAVDTPAVTDTQTAPSSEAPTPAPLPSQQDSGDEESEEDEDEEDMIDEDVQDQQAFVQRTRSEITDLENTIRAMAAKTATLGKILRNIQERKIQDFRDQLRVKKASIGEGEEE